MRVLTVAASDLLGGASIAAYRSHRALRAAGIEAAMLVWRKTSADASVHRLAPWLNLRQRVQRRIAMQGQRLQLRRLPRQADSAYWSLNQFSYPIADAINQFAADIVHLHWVGDNFLPIQQFERIEAPIVWTLHDMWAFTGGCHYAGDCRHYREACGNCPQLLRPASRDPSARIHARKMRSWAGIPMTIVAPSRWLADCARQSAVLRDKRIVVIANPIDTRAFKPLDQRAARQAFNLPQDKPLALFGAADGTADPRKGFAFLRAALNAFPKDAGIELVVFGAGTAAKGRAKHHDIHHDMPTHRVGALRDSVSLNLLYAACDVFVLPSLQDNLPNTLMEALACGRPCVAFDTGGIGDLIQHQENGYLARLADAADLRRGIKWTLAQEWYPERIHQRAQERYSAERISERYIELYQSILGDSA